jgi:Dipeptidyl aminopeptidases/acylaminoacyl-peptidases
MKNGIKYFSKPSRGLALALIIILVGSFFASMFNTSFFSVDVERISFETEKGTLSGLLYMPKGASADDPRPTIVTTHGYLNSAEMQDAPAIEMSKRGFVVLALDMYDHGHSMTKIDTDSAAAFFSFWPTSLHDAVQFMYDQPYVKKDDMGNGIIAVSGHSMGGFSTTMAMVMDEQAFASTGIRKISAGLTVGADFLWTSYLEVTEEVASAAMGPRTSGKIGAHFDEFFFDMSAASEGRSVTYKDYIMQPEGLSFLGNPENPVQGQFYTVEAGGLRVIYTPNETHPWNHFSSETTKDQIEFYKVAFAGELSPSQRYLASDNQTWFLKELFEGIAMVGFFMLLLPLATLLITKIKLFNTNQQVEESSQQGNSNKTLASKLGVACIAIISAAFPAYFYPTFMGKLPDQLLTLQRGCEVLVVLGLLAVIVSFVVKAYQTKANKITAVVLLIFAVLGRFMMSNSGDFFKQSAYFNAPTVNQFVFWAVSAATFSVLLMMVIHLLTENKNNKISLKDYGLTISIKEIGKALALAVTLSISAIIVMILVDAIFLTDFRFWTFAVKTFEPKHLFSALRYMPFFLLFYLVNGIAINKMTFNKKGHMLLAIFMNIGGLIVFLALQYGKLFVSGTGLYPGESLTSIILIGMVPVLLIATIYSKKLYEKTGNVLTGAFLNTILMTLITIANTVVYSKLIG